MPRCPLFRGSATNTRHPDNGCRSPLQRGRAPRWVPCRLPDNSNDAAVMTGVYDATSALLLKGSGGGNFTAVPAFENGLNVKGESRKMVYLKDKNKTTLIFLKNEAPAQVFVKE